MLKASLLLWLFPLIPILSGVLFYFSVKRGWPLVIGFLIGAGSHPIIWVGVLLLNQAGGREQAVMPILAALFLSVAVRVAILVKASREKDDSKSVAQNRKLPSTRYLMTAMLAVPLLAVPFIFWWLAKINARELLVYLVPMMLIGFVVFLFERSQYKSQKQ
jgi:hypothetical protein